MEIQHSGFKVLTLNMLMLTIVIALSLYEGIAISSIVKAIFCAFVLSSLIAIMYSLAIYLLDKKEQKKHVIK